MVEDPFFSSQVVVERPVRDPFFTPVAVPHQGRRIDFGGLPRVIAAQQENRFDAVAAISGREGSGKSSLGIQVCEAVDERFDVAKNIVFSNKQLRARINMLQDKSAIMVDEAILTSWKHEWAISEQKETNKLLTLCRSRGHFIAFVLPSLFDLNSYLRDHRVRIHVYVPVRGYGMIFTRPPIDGLEDPWRRQKWKEIAERWRPTMTTNEVLRMVRRIPGYTKEFKFPPLPEAQEVKYRKFRDDEISKEEESEGRSKKGRQNDVPYLQAIYRLVNGLETKGVKPSEIAAVCGVEVQQLKDWIEKAAKSFETLESKPADSVS